MIHFMYVFCLLVWGLNFIAVKIQGMPVSLELSLTYRTIGASILFLMLAFWLKRSLIIHPRNLVAAAFFGICNFAVSYLLLYYATIMSTAALVTLVFSMKVALTPIFISVFLGQKLQNRILFGGVIGLFGIGVLLYPTLNYESAYLVGVFLAFIGTTITAIGDTISARNAREEIDPIAANSIGSIAATALLVGVCIIQGQKLELSLSLHYVAALLYLTVLASFVCWIFYLKLVSQIGASASSYMVALFPAVGGVASVLLGESDLSISLVLGCMLSCIGAVYASGAWSRIKPLLIPRNSHS